MYVPYLIAQGISLCFLLAALGLVAVSIGTNYWSETTFLLSQDAMPVDKLQKQASSFYGIEKADGLWRECSAVFSMQNRLIEGTHDSFRMSRALVYEYCFNRYQSVVDQSRQLLSDAQFDLRSIESRGHEIYWWQIATMTLMCVSALFGAAATFTTPLHYPKCRGLTAFLVLLAAISSGVGVVIYSCCYDQIDVTYHDQMQSSVSSRHFGWSLWCAVGGCASFLSASVGFIISAKLRHLREYSRTAKSAPFSSACATELGFLFITCCCVLPLIAFLIKRV